MQDVSQCQDKIKLLPSTKPSLQSYYLQKNQNLLTFHLGSWKQVLDINIGHRRKLQKEIKKTRDLAHAQQTQYMQEDIYKSADQEQMSTYLDLGVSDTLTAEIDSCNMEVDMPTKRSYRHYPELDPNAPKRPYSAYMLFSNHVRELLASENLEFPEISRQVGARWQALDEKKKKVWKWQAQPLWERYKLELMQYQGTEADLEHKRYLEAFKIGEANRCSQKGAAGQEVFKRPSTTLRESANINSSPGEISVGTGYALNDLHSLTTSASEGPLGPSLHKLPEKLESELPVGRIDEPAIELSKEIDRKSKSKQACEPCRRRKTRCDEKRPTCGHCLSWAVDCYYSEAKMQTDKR